MCNSDISWSSNHKWSLYEAKTKIMLICQKCDMELFNIYINVLRNPLSLEVHLLGLTIGHRLSWVPHLNRRMKAAKRAFYSLGASLKFTWGSDRRRFWHLYCSSVEPILLYGCSVSTHIQAKRESNCPDLFSGCSLHPSLKPLKLPLSSPDGSIKLAPSWSLGSRNYYSYAPFSWPCRVLGSHGEVVGHFSI